MRQSFAPKFCAREQVFFHRIGYVPSSAARAMRSNRTGLIGVISGAIYSADDEPHQAGLPDLFIVKGIQEVLAQAGQTMLLTDSGGDALRVPELVRTFVEHRVDGLIYVAPYHQQVELPELNGLPVVIANGYDARGTVSVVPDDYAGMRQLVTGLIARGHRRIAYLQLPLHLDATRLRTQAYVDALAAAGIDRDAALILPADIDHTDPEVRMAVLRRAVEKALSASPAPSVLCCGNDRMAMAVYGLLRTTGRRVPDDLSIAGYDDYRLISETLFPQLTSVELPYRSIGRAAAELLTRKSTLSDPVLVGGEVTWRESVAPGPHSA